MIRHARLAAMLLAAGTVLGMTSAAASPATAAPAVTKHAVGSSPE
jgi:hypothetical protein